MAARERSIHYVEQLEKWVPFVTSKCSFGKDVSELASGVNTFHLDHCTKIHPVEQPVKCHSVGAGYVSHRRASAFDDHLDHCLIVLRRCTIKRYGGGVLRLE